MQGRRSLPSRRSRASGATPSRDRPCIRREGVSIQTRGARGSRWPSAYRSGRSCVRASGGCAPGLYPAGVVTACRFRGAAGSGIVAGGLCPWLLRRLCRGCQSRRVAARPSTPLAEKVATTPCHQGKQLEEMLARSLDHPPEAKRRTRSRQRSASGHSLRSSPMPLGLGRRAGGIGSNRRQRRRASTATPVLPQHRWWYKAWYKRWRRLWSRSIAGGTRRGT